MDAKIFLSYAQEDSEKVQILYDTLTALDFTVWYDKSSLLPGQRFVNTIEDAIQSCQLFLACISENSIGKRGFVQSELKRALDVIDQMPEDAIFIVPIRLDDSEVPRQLKPFQYLDFNGSIGSAVKIAKKLKRSLNEEFIIEKTEGGPPTLAWARNSILLLQQILWLEEELQSQGHLDLLAQFKEKKQALAKKQAEKIKERDQLPHKSSQEPSTAEDYINELIIKQKVSKEKMVKITKGIVDQFGFRPKVSELAYSCLVKLEAIGKIREVKKEYPNDPIVEQEADDGILKLEKILEEILVYMFVLDKEDLLE